MAELEDKAKSIAMSMRKATKGPPQADMWYKPSTIMRYKLSTLMRYKPSTLMRYKPSTL